jgi:hypothetical protein
MPTRVKAKWRRRHDEKSLKNKALGGGRSAITLFGRHADDGTTPTVLWAS